MATMQSITIRRISNKYLVQSQWGANGLEAISNQGRQERIFDTYEELNGYLRFNFGLIKMDEAKDADL